MSQRDDSFLHSKTPGINRAFCHRRPHAPFLAGTASFSWNASRFTPKPSCQRHSTIPLE
ncbi:hypothetical protein KCP78_09075 [Salmonella enterica subsp. enterica]|nr:hypothetical protein KCP78_09075 [Salmonella enterica subsp. enterica]